MEVVKLSQKQRALFDQFLDAVSDCRRIEWSDDYMLKWLVARDFDLGEAEAMFRQSIEWRRINQIDEIDRWTPPEVLRKYYACGWPGNDKQGCPIFLSAYGRMDLAGILQSVTKRDYIRFNALIAEKNLRLTHQNSQKLGKSVSLSVIIIDLEHLAVSHLYHKDLIDIGVESIRVAAANYPEAVRRVFIINVQPIFTTTYVLVKPFLGSATQSKLRIFGHDSKVWKAALLEEIDADQLPVHYGGTQTDPDGNSMCLDKMCMGGEVPKSYYMNEKTPPKPLHNMKSELVGPGNHKRLEISIGVINSIIRWKFITENGDICFQIFHVHPDGEKKYLVARDHFNSHYAMEEGEVVCIYSGTYIVEFDNSHSYFRSKNLWYTIDVVKPE